MIILNFDNYYYLQHSDSLSLKRRLKTSCEVKDLCLCQNDIGLYSFYGTQNTRRTKYQSQEYNCVKRGSCWSFLKFAIVPQHWDGAGS